MTNNSSSSPHKNEPPAQLSKLFHSYSLASSFRCSIALILTEVSVYAIRLYLYIRKIYLRRYAAVRVPGRFFALGVIFFLDGRWLRRAEKNY
eukprot:scaffold6338_cov152-Skeletonema_menzelii.AAC.14